MLLRAQVLLGKHPAVSPPCYLLPLHRALPEEEQFLRAIPQQSSSSRGRGEAAGEGRSPRVTTRIVPVPPRGAAALVTERGVRRGSAAARPAVLIS